MKRDEVAITGAKVSAVNCAREWIRKLVKVGASADEIAEVIRQMTKQAQDEARILRVQCDTPSLSGPLIP